MEKDRRIYTFEGNLAEDFQLWQARTQAALEGKECWSVVKTNQLVARPTDQAGAHDQEVTVTSETELKICKARALMIQVLGSKPLKLVLPVKDNPFKIWERLNERYAATNTATKVQLQMKLNRMVYKGQSMFETLYNKLDIMKCNVRDDMRVATLLASFGDKNKTSFGHTIANIQSGNDAESWDAAASRLPQEFDEQEWAGEADTDKKKKTALAFNANDEGEVNRRSPRNNQRRKETRRCFNCKKVGHIARNCRQRKRDEPEKYGGSNKRFVQDESNHAVMLMAIEENATDDAERFIIDSGATNHMVTASHWMTAASPCGERKVTIGNGKCVPAQASGPVHLLSNCKDIHLKEAILVEELHVNLLSCAALCKAGCEVKFNEYGCEVRKSGQIILTGECENGLYVIKSTLPRTPDDAAHITKEKEFWHERFCHANVQSIRDLQKSEAVSGINGAIQKKDCEACPVAKQSKNTVHSNKHRAEIIGAVIHSDVCGKLPTESVGGSLYFVTFIDEASRYVTVQPIENNSDVKEIFIKYLAWFERKFGCRIKQIHSDGGGEYISLIPYLNNKGIESNITPAYTPELNGIAERMNRTLVESTRAILSHANMSRYLWEEAVVAAADVRNRMIAPHVKDKTPYQIIHGNKTRVDHLRVLGSKAWVHIPKQKRDKLSNKAIFGALIGCFDSGTYKVWLAKQHHAVDVKHVQIAEGCFHPNSWYSQIHDNSGSESVISTEEETHSTDNDEQGDEQEEPTKNAEDTDELTYTPARPSTYGESDEDIESDQIPEVNVPSSQYPTRIRRRTDFFDPSAAFMATVSDDPLSYANEISRPDSEKWQAAILNEMDSILKNNTFK